MQVRVNWAFQKDQREDTSQHCHIFVGDLSNEVNDRALFEAFEHCGNCSDARVMWDHATGRCVKLLSCIPVCTNSLSVCLHDCQHTMTQDSIWPKYDFACFNLRERTNLILTDTFAALLQLDLLMCNMTCFHAFVKVHVVMVAVKSIMNPACKKENACKSKDGYGFRV